MAVVDFVQCQKQCLAILNAGPDDYSFSTLVGDERFGTLGIPSDQVKEAILAADEQVCLAILETPGHWARPDYVDWSPLLDYLDEVPAHIGATGAVRITVSNGGSLVPGLVSTINEIILWRSNQNGAYGSLQHDAVNNLLAGNYAIRDNIVYFTGAKMAVRIGTFTRSALVCQAPAIYQLTVWIGALVNLFPKEGSWLQKAAFLSSQLVNQMAAIRGGLAVEPVLDQYEEVKS